MTLLLKMHFSAWAPRNFQSLTYMPFPCTQALGKIPILTHMPFRRRVGSSAVRTGRPWPSSGARPPRSSPRGDWRGWPARRRLRRGRATVAGGGGHGGLRLRRGRRNAEQRATAQASLDPREEFRTVGRHRGRTEGQVTGGRQWRARWSSRSGGGLAHTRGGVGRP
jgi:hypothetical protein